MRWLEFQVLFQNPLLWKLWAASSWHHISVICVCWSPGAWGVNDEIFTLVTVHFLSTKSLCYHLLEKELWNSPAKYASAFVKNKKNKKTNSVHEIRFPVWIRCLGWILDHMMTAFPVTFFCCFQPPSWQHGWLSVPGPSLSLEMWFCLTG